MLKNKLLYALDVFKYQVELGKSGRTSTLGYGEEVCGLGYDNVVLSNDILAMSGWLPSVPAACAHFNGYIYVNDAFLKLDVAIQKAIVAHEAGHLQLGHMRKSLGRLIARNIGRIFGGDEALRCEREADLFARDAGHDMVAALTNLKNTIGWVIGKTGCDEIDERIQYLSMKS